MFCLRKPCDGRCKVSVAERALAGVPLCLFSSFLGVTALGLTPKPEQLSLLIQLLRWDIRAVCTL